MAGSITLPNAPVPFSLPNSCSKAVNVTPVFQESLIVKRNPIHVILKDGDKLDGDTVAIYVINNGVKTLEQQVGLTKEPISYEVKLKPGKNIIRVEAVSPGFISLPAPLTTLWMRIDKNDIVGNGQNLIRQNLTVGPLPGSSVSIAASFPQIGISKGIHPQSACHMVEAWAGAGQQNDPRGRFQPPRPHLVTIDRPNNETRRNASTYPFECTALKPNGKKADNKDEYPQALFEENGSAASVKCVQESDNKGSGSQIKNQINGNSFYGGIPNPYGRLDDGSVVEMVVRD